MTSKLEDNLISKQDVVLDSIELDNSSGDKFSDGQGKDESEGNCENNETVNASRPPTTIHQPCLCCNDSERAILNGYVALMRQCIELAEKMIDAKA